MQNHIVDGTIEGHCDCMFMTNTYRWDFAQVAALVAPRPLLISNSDKDTIFPLDGVERLHSQVARIYKLNKAEKNLGLLITEGPHKDTQELQLPAFKWFNRFLKNDLKPIQVLTQEKFFEPEQLRVFKVGKEPTDSINLNIAQEFIAEGRTPPVPESGEALSQMREGLLEVLKAQVFGGWPKEDAPIDVKETHLIEKDGWKFSAYEFASDGNVRPTLYVVQSAAAQKGQWLNLYVLDENEWKPFVANMRKSFGDAFKDEPEAGDVLTGDGPAAGAYLAVRGVGPSAWNVDDKKRTQILRRYWLLGQTLEGMRVYDIRRAIQAMRSLDKNRQLRLTGFGEMGTLAMYASLFEPPVKEIELLGAPSSHVSGPQLLNVLKVMDVPVAAALAAQRNPVRVVARDVEAWKYPRQVAAKLGWTKEFEVVPEDK
jgi:hypothetical protein